MALTSLVCLTNALSKLRSTQRTSANLSRLDESEHNDGPVMSGKYPRLTVCPPDRAPRDYKEFLLRKPRKSMRAQPRQLERYRKKQARHATVAIDSHSPKAELADQPSWPQISLPMRPKAKSQRKKEEPAKTTTALRSAKLSIRSKPWSEKFKVS